MPTVLEGFMNLATSKLIPSTPFCFENGLGGLRAWGREAFHHLGRSVLHDDSCQEQKGALCPPLFSREGEQGGEFGETGRQVRGATVAILLVLALLAVLPYGNALHNGFTLDDEPDILKNVAVTGGIDLTGILSSSLFGILYRPLTIFTFALNYALTPGQATSFHAVNILLHCGVTLLVFALGVQLFESRRLAAIAAALFAVHPVHTEAVTNVVGRAELLAAFFGLGTLISAARAEGAATRWRRAAWQWLALASFCLALLSKESALTVLPLMALLRITYRGESLRTGLKRELCNPDWVAYGLCIGLFLVVRGYVIAAAPEPYRPTPLDNVLAFVPWSVRVRTALGVLWDYFGLLNVPLVLAADYSYPQVPLVQSWFSPRCLAGLALVTLACAASWLQRANTSTGPVRRRLRHLRCTDPECGATGGSLCSVGGERPGRTDAGQHSPLAFAILFPLVALGLTANLLFPIGTVKAERLLYLPSVGWVLVVAFACEQLLRQPRYRAVARGALLITLVLFAVRTWTRNADWTDNLTLYRSMARTAPDSAKARYNFGVALQKQGAHEAAIVQFRQALALYPWAEGAALGIGYSLRNSGSVDAAVPWYEKALEIAPALSEAHADLCSAHLSEGRLDAAAIACRNGLRYDPTDANLLKGLGLSLVASGAIDEGIEVLRRSMALNPSDDGLRMYIAQLQSDSAALRCRSGPIE